MGVDVGKAIEQQMQGWTEHEVELACRADAGLRCICNGHKCRIDTDVDYKHMCRLRGIRATLGCMRNKHECRRETQM